MTTRSSKHSRQWNLWNHCVSSCVILDYDHPPFFFCLASNAFPDIGSVGQIEKKTLKKITRSLGIGGPSTPAYMKHIYIFRRVSFSYIYIFGLTKCILAILLKKCSCFCSCFSLHYPMLIFQIKRIISSEKWFNYIVTFFFFWKCPKFGLVSRTTLNRGKKRGWPMEIAMWIRNKRKEKWNERIFIAAYCGICCFCSQTSWKWHSFEDLKRNW